jgi:hypothetical protein
VQVPPPKVDCGAAGVTGNAGFSVDPARYVLPAAFTAMPSIIPEPPLPPVRTGSTREYNKPDVWHRASGKNAVRIKSRKDTHGISESNFGSAGKPTLLAFAGMTNVSLLYGPVSNS